MLRLLSAEFSRLFKNKIFYVLCGVAAAFGAFMPIINYATLNRNSEDYVPYSDSGAFAIFFFGGVISAIFVSLFIGTEYSDGTMRNKLICGHTRTSLYFSGFTVNFCASALIYICFFIVLFTIGTAFFRNYQYSVKEILLLMDAGFANLFAYTSVFTAISFCNRNKAGTAVVSLVLCMALIVVSFVSLSRLAEPEVYPAAMCMSADGTLYEQDEEPNPNYVSGKKREVLQFVADFLPAGQGFVLSGFTSEPEFKKEYILYSLILSFASDLVAVPVFRKKNIN